MIKGKLILLGAVVLMGIWASGCNVLSFPDIAGTWDLTFHVDGSNCPAVISPDMSTQIWIVQQDESQVSVVIQTVDGKNVGYQFAVAATIQTDGQFSFNETFYETYKSYHLRMNIICTATVSGDSISGIVRLNLQDMDTLQSCTEYGTVEGTRRPG